MSILSAVALADAMLLYLGLPGSDTAELAEQLERIAGWPIDGYLVTYRAGVNLANDTLLKLAERYNIVAAKDCCAYPAQSSS